LIRKFESWLRATIADGLRKGTGASKTVPVLLKTIVEHNAALLLHVALHDRAKVERYARRWEAGEKWPAIRFRYGIIMDGFHRVCAALLLKHTTIESRK
jgi:hypothetical protein